MQIESTMRRARHFCSAGICLLAACGGGEAPEPETHTEGAVDMRKLTIYSPAPPTIMLHAHNEELGSVLSACQVANTVTPVALPKSINDINQLAAEEKPFHLPIVTTIDFLPAISQTGPEWHAYANANSDLKFVASLYDVAFGMLAFDEAIRTPEDLKGKRIGAPPRPSAVRLYTEALLRDGWGILDEVEIVDIVPPDLIAAIDEGRIDATSWGLMSETADGFLPMMPPLMTHGDAHWIAMEPEVAERINQHNDFRVAETNVPGGEGRSVRLLSFKQALAAWEDTPDEVVRTVLGCMTSAGGTANALPSTPAEMANWPGLEPRYMHEAAVAFYQQHGVQLD